MDFYFHKNSSISLVKNTLKLFEQYEKIDRKMLRKPIDLKYNPGVI